MATSHEVELILATTPSPGVRVLALNRPQKRNALSQALINDLVKELAAASSDSGIRVVIITGSGAFFSAGADIKEISALNAEIARKQHYLKDLCDSMRSIRKPLIAAVEGMALTHVQLGGGFEVALMCDLIIASSNAKLGLPEVKIGLIPGAGGTQRLTNALGKFRTMNIILRGEPIVAEEAGAYGLVAKVAEPGLALQSAVSTAGELAALSPTALSLAKEAICRSDDLGRDEEFERSLYYFAFGTADKAEGVGAFLEKRTPSWK